MIGLSILVIKSYVMAMGGIWQLEVALDGQ